MDPDYDESWVSVILSQYLIQIDIVFSNGGSRGVPADNDFSRVDLPHHVRHGLKENMI